MSAHPRPAASIWLLVVSALFLWSSELPAQPPESPPEPSVQPPAAQPPAPVPQTQQPQTQQPQQPQQPYPPQYYPPQYPPPPYYPPLAVDCYERCRDKGECVMGHDGCVAALDAHCRASQLCVRAGRCSARDGRCVATSRDLCLRSTQCGNGGNCFLDPVDGRCEPKRENEKAMIAGLVLVGVGGVTIIAGALTAFLTAYNVGNDSEPADASFVLIAVGGGIALVGMPIAIYGAQKIQPKYQPQLSIGPTGGSLMWTF